MRKLKERYRAKSIKEKMCASLIFISFLFYLGNLNQPSDASFHSMNIDQVNMTLFPDIELIERALTDFIACSIAEKTTRFFFILFLDEITFRYV